MRLQTKRPFWVLVSFGACVVALIWCLIASCQINNRWFVVPPALLILVCLVICVCWLPFIRLISRLYARKLGRIFAVIVASTVIVVVLVFAIVSSRMLEAAKAPFPSDSTIILLGCQIRGYEPSPLLLGRMNMALDFLTSNPSSICIVSGGKGPGESISEAECMRAYMVDRGISGDRIILEDRSTSTQENIAYSKALMDEHGFPMAVAIVTDSFHQLRAQTYAKQLGLQAGALSVETPVVILPFYWFREVIAVIETLFVL